MAAVTQIRQRHSDGRAYYNKKLAEGKTPKEALRALKRRVSDAIYRQLQADARRAATPPGAAGPGGQPGNDSDSSAAGSHPEHRRFGPATPGPEPTLRPRPDPQGHNSPRPAAGKTATGRRPAQARPAAKAGVRAIIRWDGAIVTLDDEGGYDFVGRT